MTNWRQFVNSSSVVPPLFQNESKCETILMKMTLICMKIKLHAELIFIWKVSHFDSFWNRGIRELRSGLLSQASYILEVKFESSIVFKVIYARLLRQYWKQCLPVMMCNVLLQCNQTKLKTQGLPVSLYPAPQVTHGCLREVSLESVPEFVKFSFTVHSDTYTIWVTVTLVRLASAAGRLENDSTQEILSWYANALRKRIGLR